MTDSPEVPVGILLAHVADRVEELGEKNSDTAAETAARLWRIPAVRRAATAYAERNDGEYTKEMFRAEVAHALAVTVTASGYFPIEVAHLIIGHFAAKPHGARRELDAWFRVVLDNRWQMWRVSVDDVYVLVP